MQATSTVPDIQLIKRQARARSRGEGSMTYMQYLDQVARELYGVRHFHEARARYRSATTATAAAVSPLQHYLRSMQEYYLDF